MVLTVISCKNILFLVFKLHVFLIEHLFEIFSKEFCENQIADYFRKITFFCKSVDINEFLARAKTIAYHSEELLIIALLSLV